MGFECRARLLLLSRRRSLIPPLFSLARHRRSRRGLCLGVRPVSPRPPPLHHRARRRHRTAHNSGLTRAGHGDVSGGAREFTCG
jgi:hypothetical protein